MPVHIIEICLLGAILEDETGAAKRTFGASASRSLPPRGEMASDTISTGSSLRPEEYIERTWNVAPLQVSEEHHLTDCCVVDPCSSVTSSLWIRNQERICIPVRHVVISVECW